jgi:glycosyltransferase involved in cell wall biosynthesis
MSQHLNPSYETYRKYLIHTPPRQWQGETELTLHIEYNSQAPKFSLIIPIHNQEAFVTRQLESILANTIGQYEIITILDNCTDTSKERLLVGIETVQIPSNLSSITVFENQAGMFETSADNLGFTKARGEILIEIQADMEILTNGYNLSLAYPLIIYSDLIAISGRCCHRINKNSLGFNVGKIGRKVESPHEILQHYENYNAIFLSHTVNRGPLALAKEKIAELGYLDEFHYCLGEDDHDLFLRAWKAKNWRTGFIPIEFHSPLERGSTRKVRTPESEHALQQRKKRQADGYFSLNHKKTVYPSSEIRRPNNAEKIRAIQSLMSPRIRSQDKIGSPWQSQ